MEGGLSRAAAARLCGVSERSWRAYEAGERPIPLSVWALLCLHVDGVPLGREWAGWRIQGDALVSPDGIEFSAKQVQELPWVRQVLRGQQNSQPYERAARIALDPENPRPVELIAQLELVGMLTAMIYTSLLTDESPAARQLADGVQALMVGIAHSQRETASFAGVWRGAGSRVGRPQSGGRANALPQAPGTSKSAVHGSASVRRQGRRPGGPSARPARSQKAQGVKP
ncbi:DUF3653 domain-containing protein [Thioalkalivibrio sulfidiphilus]|uniref:DUF3653 domain-containing protein n=1 Tax=Thioalkalivibrio sulfidiphilus TaxID=1033854 RepID=UPI0022AC690A|nr:DUF3653 domain-containing protein [Thioalkalivibrio sulfidiphilus]